MKKQNVLLDGTPPTRGTQQFLDYAAESDDLMYLPSYWKRRSWKNDQTSRLVRTGPKVTSSINDTILQTWQPDLVGLGRDARGLARCDIEVVSIERFEAPELYGHYLQERKKLFSQCKARGRPCPDIQRLPGSQGRVKSTEILQNFMKQQLYWEVGENYLFHGTKAESVQSILFSGLDPSFSSPDGMFGKAVYTTDSFTKADQYTDSKHARSQPGTDLYMILARVLLGRVYVCATRDETRNLHGPPCTRCNVHACNCRSSSRYDSVMADGDWMFREFAVHEKYRCYPEYVIKYRRKDERLELGNCGMY